MSDDGVERFWRTSSGIDRVKRRTEINVIPRAYTILKGNATDSFLKLSRYTASLFLLWTRVGGKSTRGRTSIGIELNKTL